MSVIKVENISKHFGTIKAVEGLSFKVEEGQVFGFLGQNGSGKSTTIRMLLSLIHPSAGNIEIFGKTLSANRDVLEQVGAIIERPDVYPYLSALEHLQLFSKLRKQKIHNSQIVSTLEKVGLAHRAKDKVATFSLGMKQRLGIAIALLHNPSLIILDEPTNGLDPQGIADIRRLIQQLATQEGKTVLVSSHLLSEIEQVAHQILILHQGKKIVEGATQELLDPEKRIIQIKTINDTVALASIKSSGFEKFLLPRKEGIYLKLPTMDIALLNAHLVNAGIAILGIETKHTLEDYFLQITSNA